MGVLVDAAQTEETVQRLVAKHGEGLDAGTQLQLAQILRESYEHLAARVNLCNAAELSRPCEADIAALPDVQPDEELAELQRQVSETHRAVLARRQAVPERLKCDLAEMLQHARPSTDAAAGEDAATPTAGEPHQLSPAPERLRSSLENLLAGMPKLRAQLAEAVERLDRVAASAAADMPVATTATPAKGEALPDDADAAAVSPAAATMPVAEKPPAVSPALDQAVRSGRISTRRRVAKHSATQQPRQLFEAPQS